MKIIISGEIGWEVMPDDIRSQLDKAKGEDLDIHIASPGGIVSYGIEIFNMIRDYKREYPESQILMTIKGIAASMASYLAVNPAVDLVAAEDNAVFMIHNVWGGTVGDYKEMQKTAEILEGHTSIIGKAYAKKSKKSIKEIRNLMDSEGWFFGNEIFENGFVDEMIEIENKADKITEISEAKSKFSNLSEKINKSDRNEIRKLAALIVPEKIEQPPADAGNNKTEVIPMTLTGFMAENPTAKIEIDKMLGDKFEAGKEEGKKIVQENVSAAAKYLDPGTEYPATIKAIAIEVLDGKTSAEALRTTVSAFDAFRESQNSNAAQLEAAAIGDTPGDQPPVITQDGIIKNEADFNAEVRRTRIAQGKEV